ncbi:DUF4190 domain-containing protein [Gordonia crocea]|uniref:DUF4190 domain-containing protein n=1 Tax=Gordonia crocea TaxID=589162 RepID=A0A7I9UW30_9ACTN|nr:DUF4190 domain-containing protein [Gordonia crocea]GED96980.1 hypothetical protein nbrc107697_10190 [Gordonia crocea]
MTTSETPEESANSTAAAAPQPISLTKDDAATASVPIPGDAAAGVVQTPAEAVYYSDQQSYPAQGYPAGSPQQQASYPPVEPQPAQYGAPASYAPAPDQYAAAYGSAYGTPAYSGYGAAYPTRSSTNGMAIAALIVGLVGFVLTICFVFSGVITGTIALILGAVALKQINNSPGGTSDGGSKVMAIVGLVLGSLQLLGSIVVIVVLIVASVSG